MILTISKQAKIKALTQPKVYRHIKPIYNIRLKFKNRTIKKKYNSEFGKGLTYCLGLFLAHADNEISRPSGAMVMITQYGLWFNGAADHLFELQIPKFLPDQLYIDLGYFKAKCLNLRYSKATRTDYEWAINQAKFLLRQIDSFYNIPTEQGEFE